MGIEQWHISKVNEGIYGDVFLLSQLQERTSDGGGENLLGSPVQKISKIGFGNDYPIPRLFGNPQALVTKLNSLKATLGITGNITNTIAVAGSNSSIKIEKKRLFNVGVGNFPFLPLTFGLDIDFSRTKDIQIKFGDGTFFENINAGYLAQLYENLNGKPSADIGGNFLKENYFVKEILLAKNYEVSFNSEEDFKADFNAKLDAFKVIPEVKAKVNFSSTGKRTLNAKISGETYYLVGLTASTWKSLK